MKKLIFFLIFTAGALNAQNIVSVVPNYGIQGQQLDVTITSDNNTYFSNVSETSNVSFFNTFSQYFFINSINQTTDHSVTATVTIPLDVATGPYKVSVYNGFQTAILNNGFIVWELSTSDFDSNSMIMVYPNPANQKVNLTIPKDFVNASVCKIVNTQGKEVFRYSPKAEKTEINISKLSKGIYFLKTTFNGKEYMKKLIKN